MNCGIYKIENRVNGKVYIGSSKNLNDRFYKHEWRLNSSNHKHHSTHLQRAWNKYGEDSFIFEVLLYCNEENLEMYEQREMDKYESYNHDNGYNIKPKADHSELSEETKRKISKNTPDNGIDPPTFYGEDNPNYGKPRADEVKQKISETKKGRTMKEQTKNKISNSLKGREVTWEDKIAEASKGEGGNSKLKEPQVKEIKKTIKNNENKPLKEISKNYPVGPSAISAINCGKKWPHVGNYNYPIRGNGG